MPGDKAPKRSSSRRKKQDPQRPKPRANSKIGPFRLVLLGEAAVGKTSIVLRLTEDRFKELDPTVGAAFTSHAVDIEDYTIKYEMWDTAGQERFHCLAPMYYRGAQACILVFDITDRVSFQKAKDWVREIQRLANPDIIVCLTGNKSDLEDRRMVSYEEGKEYAAANGFIYIETSAKSGRNVKEIFSEIGRKLPKDFQPRTNPLPLNPDVPKPKKEKCACG